MKIGTFFVAFVFFVALLCGIVFLSRQGGTPLPVEEVISSSDSKSFVPPEISPTGPHPSVVVNQLRHDFGTMELGDTGQYTFVIRNDGEAPLILKQGETTCKCTISNVSDNTLKPGESAEATLEWEPKQADPAFEQRAKIWTNDPAKVRIDLTVIGRVENLLDIYPAEGVDLGILPQRGIKQGLARVYSALLDDFEITGFESSVPELTVTWEKIPPATIAQAETYAQCGYDLLVSLDSRIAVGKFRGELILQTDARDRKIVVPVEASRAAPFKVLPRKGTKWSQTAGTLSMGRFRADEGRKAEALLFLIGEVDEPVEVTDIEVEPSFLKVDIKRDDRFKQSGQQRFDLTIEFPPGSTPGAWSGTKMGTLKAKTSLPDLPVLEMTLFLVAF